MIKDALELAILFELNKHLKILNESQLFKKDF